MKAINIKRPVHADGDLALLAPAEALQRFSAHDNAAAHMNLQRILVPTDFSRESAKAVRYAVTMARQFDASVTLVHVVEPSYAPPEFGGGPMARHTSDKQRLARAKTKLGVM